MFLKKILIFLKRKKYEMKLKKLFIKEKMNFYEIVFCIGFLTQKIDNFF